MDLLLMVAEKKVAVMTIDTGPICVPKYLVNTNIPPTVVIQKRQPGSISMSNVKIIEEENDIYSLFVHVYDSILKIIKDILLNFRGLTVSPSHDGYPFPYIKRFCIVSLFIISLLCINYYIFPRFFLGT